MSEMIDWSKPIQHRNGQLCELVETNSDGWKQWGARADGSYPTRMVHRLGMDESTMGGGMTAYWFMHEDGKSTWPGGEFDIINRPEGTND